MLTVEYCMDVLMDDMVPREIVEVLAEENTESCKRALELLEFDLTKFGSFDNWRNSFLQALEEGNKILAEMANLPPGEFHEEKPIILCA